jgi:hypothetical protein
MCIKIPSIRVSSFLQTVTTFASLCLMRIPVSWHISSTPSLVELVLVCVACFVFFHSLVVRCFVVFFSFSFLFSFLLYIFSFPGV